MRWAKVPASADPASKSAHWPITRVVMRSRIILPILLAVAAAIGVAAPARAVEVGVVKSLDHTLPAAATTQGLKAGWIRLWAD